MPETTESKPVALSSLALVDVLAGLNPLDQHPRDKLAWLVAEARKTQARAAVIADNERILDLKKTCESQTERITDFADTLDNMLGHGLAGPDVPAWLKKKGANVGELRALSEAADRLQSNWEDFVSDFVAHLETAEVD